MDSNKDEINKWIEILDEVDKKAFKAINKLAKTGNPEAVEALIQFGKKMRIYEAELIDVPIIGGGKIRKNLEEKYGIHTSFSSKEVKLLIENTEYALIGIGNITGIKFVLGGDNPQTIYSALIKFILFDPCWKIKFHSRSERNPEAVSLGFGLESEPDVIITDLEIRMVHEEKINEYSKNDNDPKITEELIDSLIRVLNGGNGKIYRSISAVAALVLSGVKHNPTVIQALRDILNNKYPNSWKPDNVYAPKIIRFILPGDETLSPTEGQILAECVGLALIRLNDSESNKSIVQKAFSEYLSYQWSDLIFHAYKYLFKDGLEDFITEIMRPALDPHPRFIAGSLGGEIDIRIKIVNILESVGGNNVIQPLIFFLGSEDHFIRIRAMKLLGKLGDASALASLNEQLNDDNRKIRRNAKKAIKRIEERRE